MTHDPKVFGLLRGAMVGLILSVVTAFPLLASTPDCEALAARAAAERGIPEGLLPSIARVESGRGQGSLGRRAWPWTLNEAGKGMYFDTRAEAMEYLRTAIARGVRNIDVGCMQINYRWHGEQFDSLDAMMDPDTNTRYAAHFLSELRAQHGSWEVATGFYHSMTPDRSRHYRQLVARVLGTIPSPSEMLARLNLAEPASGHRQHDVAYTVQGLVPRGNGPLVHLHAQETVPLDRESSYQLAMSGGGSLPEAALPNLDMAQSGRRVGFATGAMDRDWVRTQIASLRADFDKQFQEDSQIAP